MRHVRHPRTAAPPRLVALGRPDVVRVHTDAQGTPTAVARGRRWSTVIGERERWRIDDEWWRTPISRDYRVVVLDDGALLTLYLDRVSGRWHVQR